MIKKKLEQVMTSFKDAFGNNVSWPKVESDDISVNMDGGVGGSWTVNLEKVLSDEEDGLDYEDQYYTGVPAPAYLEIDPWFSPPIYSEKQMSIKEAHEQAVLDNQLLAEGDDGIVESPDIHQKMYEIATKNQSTTLHLDPPGGSENFHEGPGGWMSGTGMSQFK